MKTQEIDPTVCAICGATASQATLYSIGTMGDDVKYRICHQCYHYRSDINSYGYKPHPNFSGRGRNDRFFGVELEVVPAYNSDRGRALAVCMVKKALGDFVYLKRDGSLSDGGFEIVTHPFSFSYYTGKGVFCKLAGIPIKSFTDASCGMHVHVSRTGLTDLQLAKLVYFFSLPENEDFLKYVAQRDWNSYCRKIQKGHMMQHVRGWETRYNAINFLNGTTVEFRLFKGNAKPVAIHRAIQFCDAILEFCKATGATHMKWQDFVSFLGTAKGYKYPQLLTYVKEYNGR